MRYSKREIAETALREYKHVVLHASTERHRNNATNILFHMMTLIDEQSWFSDMVLEFHISTGIRPTPPHLGKSEEEIMNESKARLSIGPAAFSKLYSGNGEVIATLYGPSVQGHSVKAPEPDEAIIAAMREAGGYGMSQLYIRHLPSGEMDFDEFYIRIANAAMRALEKDA